MSSLNEPDHHYVESLSICNFRNLSQAHMTFVQGFHLIVGLNGHGKTNCLEAIAMACSLKPMQALQNVDLIKFDESKAAILANFSGHQRLEVDIFSQGKKAWLNDQILKRTSDLAKICALVSFIPAELAMIGGASALRRRALDLAAASLDLSHQITARAYERILLHRSRILKTWPIDHSVLKTFTEMAIQEGARVVLNRLKALAILTPIFRIATADILGDGITATLRYQADEEVLKSHTLADILSLLSAHYTDQRANEIKRKVTLFGPQLHDLRFDINGVNAKKTASRGQCRALVLAFKLAQMLAIKRERGISPIIILDDIVSELDERRADNLIMSVKNLKAQAFFSATNMAPYAHHFCHVPIYRVHNGTISHEPNQKTSR